MRHRVWQPPLRFVPASFSNRWMLRSLPKRLPAKFPGVVTEGPSPARAGTACARGNMRQGKMPDQTRPTLLFFLHRRGIIFDRALGLRKRWRDGGLQERLWTILRRGRVAARCET